MKNLKLVGLALVAMLLSVNFTSCKEDKDDDNETQKVDEIKNQKKLKQILLYSDGEFISKMDFTYAENGNLASLKDSSAQNGKNVMSYDWATNLISMKYKKYSLSSNLINTLKYDFSVYTDENEPDTFSASFSYNSSKKLVKYESESVIDNKTKSSVVDDYTWNNGQLTKVNQVVHFSEGVSSFERTYTYSGKTCKGYFPVLVESIFHDGLLTAHPELAGLRISQLPDQMFITDKNAEGELIEKLTFDYTLDEEGYVVKCIVNSESADMIDPETSSPIVLYTESYSFVWE